MSLKKIALVVVVLVIAGGAWYGFKEYYRTNRNLENVSPDFVVPAEALLQEFETNDSLATRKYNGKIIETSGNVKGIERDDQGYFTIVLGKNSELSSIRCSIDSLNQQDASTVAAGSSIVVRGACTGYNKDEMGLGSDLILNRTVIISPKQK